MRTDRPTLYPFVPRSNAKLWPGKDLGLLPRIGKIRYLELWMIKGFTDLAPM